MGALPSADCTHLADRLKGVGGLRGQRKKARSGRRTGHRQSVNSKTSEPTTKRSRRRNGAPTIADVARLAGCSSMTVSRVMNGEARVLARTADAVHKAIDALGYTPNPAARSLAGAEQVRLAILYSNPSTSYLSEFLVGGMEQANASDVQLVVTKCEAGEDVAAVAKRLINRGVDGFVLPSPLCDDVALLHMLAAADIPVVAVGPGLAPPETSSVMMDDFRAAGDMTRHIIQLGHRDIGFIIGNPEQTASERRLAGFLDAMANAGLIVRPEMVVQGLFSYRSGLDAANRLLDLAPRPTAIFASNDDMAAATVAVAHRRHLDVPVDLTVCGYDDTSIASTLWPELTTIRQPIVEMTKASVRMLISLIRNSRSGLAADPEHLWLPHELIRRQSDAAPPLTIGTGTRRMGWS